MHFLFVQFQQEVFLIPMTSFYGVFLVVSHIKVESADVSPGQQYNSLNIGLKYWHTTLLIKQFKGRVIWAVHVHSLTPQP